MKNHILTRTVALLLAGLTVVSFAACNNGGNTTETESETVAATETVTETEIETEIETESETVMDTETVVDTEAPTEAETESETETETQWLPTVSKSDLNELMQSVFEGNKVIKETVMFIDKGDTKTLMYPIGEVDSVTSYDGTRTYRAGVDYEVVDGKLKVLANSSINCIGSATYYNYNTPIADGLYLIDNNGKKLYWGEGTIQNYQICVTYTHESTWEGYTQESQVSVYEDFLKKLEAGEDVTIVFYGDSITHGASASGFYGKAPYQPPYAILFTQALADLFDYTIKYESYANKLTGAPSVPTQPYVAGTRGTITYINTAVGGWDTATAMNNAQTYLYEPIAAHGCDLLVLALGMNDGVANTGASIQQFITNTCNVDPGASVMVVSTMVPHPDTNWDGQQKNQEKHLLSAVKRQQEKGKNVAVACMTSVSQALYQPNCKTFNDVTGNNINHPNDFLCRVYAQTLLQTLIGYENMQ